MKFLLQFIQTASVLIVLSYLLSRANFFSQVDGTQKLPARKLAVMIPVFVFTALYGLITQHVISDSAYVDTRIAGIALSGLLFGYVPSAFVLAPTVVVSLFFGQDTILADIVAMILAWALSGVCHRRFSAFDAVLSGIIVGVLEVSHMLLTVLFVRPVSLAKEIIYSISFPMIVVNGLTVIAFVLVIADMNERKRLWEKESFSRSEGLVAKNLQSSLLSTQFRVDPRLELTAYLTPALDVGGDLYSFVVQDGRYFKFIIGDVSGKGVPAAITMSRCETLFQELVVSCQDPAKTLCAINQRLCQNNSVMMFVTACIGSLDLLTGHLSYANAGHVVPYCVRAGEPVRKLPRPKGKPLGILQGFLYENAELTLSPGDYFFSYTDGITEAENIEKKLFGNQRLEETLSNLPRANAAIIQDTVLTAVRDYTNGAKQSDDLALFVFGPTAPDFSYSLENTIPAFLETAETIQADLTAADTARTLKDDIALILEEIVSNIILYGYPDGRKGTVSIALWTKEIPRIVIRDDSNSFDPFLAETPNAELPPSQRAIGGLGIFLTKKRVTDHAYASCDGMNQLSMRIRLKEAAP